MILASVIFITIHSRHRPHTTIIAQLCNANCNVQLKTVQTWWTYCNYCVVVQTIPSVNYSFAEKVFLVQSYISPYQSFDIIQWPSLCSRSHAFCSYRETCVFLNIIFSCSLCNLSISFSSVSVTATQLLGENLANTSVWLPLTAWDNFEYILFVTWTVLALCTELLTKLLVGCNKYLVSALWHHLQSGQVHLLKLLTYKCLNDWLYMYLVTDK